MLDRLSMTRLWCATPSERADQLAILRLAAAASPLLSRELRRVADTISGLPAAPLHPDRVILEIIPVGYGVWLVGPTDGVTDEHVEAAVARIRAGDVPSDTSGGPFVVQLEEALPDFSPVAGLI